MIPIETGPRIAEGPAFLRDGFRPFFFGATAWGAVGMVAWWFVYALGYGSPRAELIGMQWHAHEMIFGFSMAVVTGFLLTAVRNWTGRPTLSGAWLGMLFLAWLLGRVGMVVAGVPLTVAAVADLAFDIGIVVAVVRPIAAAGQLARQMGVLSKLVALAVANALFYSGIAGWLSSGTVWGLYLGFYSVVGLVLTFGRRILPNFIANGVGHPVALRNDPRVDAALLWTFVVFIVADVFTGWSVVAAVSAGVLAVLHAYRMAGWHDRGIWRRPLLWMPYLSYAGMVIGFAMLATAPLGLFTRMVALHALGVAGIGFIAAGMIVRVSLGHSGRSIADLPRGTTAAFVLLVVAGAVRIVAPLADPLHVVPWVAGSQLAWIAGFSILAVRFAPIWFTSAVRREPAG